MKAAVAALVLFALAGCSGAPGPSVAPSLPASCHAIESRDWSAHISAMPGPNAQRTLIVSGQVDLPTPGYSISLSAGPADRSTMPVQQLILETAAPTAIVTQVITTYPVRYEGPAIAQQYRAVRIMCGGRQLAELEVIVAH